MSLIAWQGLKLELPDSWNPVRIEGDWARGQILFADLDRPRLGIRWRKFKHKSNLERSMKEEVGALAAAEASPFTTKDGKWPESLLYLEPEPPGRDVWIGLSAKSNRLIEVIHHIERPGRMLPEFVLPTLTDFPADSELPWSIFDLSCKTPGGMSLQSHRLLAGDLSLTFVQRRSVLTIRQIAVAELALARMDIKGWLANQQKRNSKHFRPCKSNSAVRLNVAGAMLEGVRSTSNRRRRYFWHRAMPRELVTYGLHDQARDRLLLLESDEVSRIESIAGMIGWATNGDLRS